MEAETSVELVLTAAGPGSAGAALRAGVRGASSTLVSREVRSSCVLFLNSRIPLPSDLPSSGRRFAPKRSRMTNENRSRNG